VKEHPILFSGPMVRAILAGNKTQTRRVVKPQPPIQCKFPQIKNDIVTWSVDSPGNFPMWDKHSKCPYGQPGDRLWVRESFYTDSDKSHVLSYSAGYDIQRRNQAYILKPSIHMPRRASRITLEITDILVERVQDIPAMDCIAEGIERSAIKDIHDAAQFEIGEYHKLWDSINAKRGYGWDVNPWVWVVEFKRV